MKLNATLSKFLTNKWVLNIVCLLALFNIIGYIVLGHLNSVLYFIVFAILVRYFSKNMTIVLGVPLIMTSLLTLKGNMVEGFKEGDADRKNNNDNTNPVVKPAIKEQKKIDELVNKSSNMTSVTSSSAASDNSAQSTGSDQQGFESGRRKNRGYNIDYATTVEDAYDELNNILGSDGIQKLTSDTQNLMKQQLQLAEAMNGMGELVKNIQPMVGQLKQMMGTSNDANGGMMDLAKKLTGQSVPAN
jgi:hypothetical protein